MFNCWKGKLSSLHTAHLSSWPPRAGTEAGVTALDLVTKAGAFPSRTLVSAEAAHLVRLAAGAYSRAAHRVWSRSFRDAVLIALLVDQRLGREGRLSLTDRVWLIVMSFCSHDDFDFE